MSTSKLQKYVSEELGKHISRFSIYENARPYWLYGSELDFYIPEINVAIEVQGQQHYEYNPFFHRTYEKFLDQQRRDKDKRYYCEKRRIKLYEIFTDKDADLLIINLKAKIENKKEGILDYYHTDPISRTKFKFIDTVEKLAENTRIDIEKFYNKEKVHDKKIFKNYVHLILWCNREGKIIKDPLLIEFYQEHKEEIDSRIRKI